MSFKVQPTPLFERELKKLSKRYFSLKTDLAALVASLKNEPMQGHALGNGAYKIRMSISSKNKGRSGGARVITYVKIIDSTVFLLSIYDKSESDTITNKELSSRIDDL